MTGSVVLDAWAVMAWLLDEPPAADLVGPHLRERPLISWVNVCEVAYRMQRERGEAAATDLVDGVVSRCATVEADRQHALAAAAVKASHQLSLADAFAAATAMVADVPLLTGDPELLVAGRRWEVVDLRVPPDAAD